MQKQKLFINFLKVQAFAEGIKIIAQTKNSNNIWDFFCFFFQLQKLAYFKWQELAFHDSWRTIL